MDYKTIVEIIDSFRKHPTRTIMVITIMALVAICAMFFSGFFTELGKRIVPGGTAKKKTIAKRSSERAVEKLEQMGIPYNESSFMKYIQRGESEVVKLFLEAGIFIEIIDDNDLTPLLIATKNGHQRVVKALLDHGANPEAIDKHRQTALIIAANEGHVDIVRSLIEKNSDVNATANFGRTALTGAARKGYTEIVKILLTKGANPNVDPECRWHPLIGAVWNRDETMTRQLLMSGVDLSYENVGARALLTAARKDSLPIVRLLLGQGVDINPRAHLQRTALMNAARDGSLELFQFLLDQGAKVNVRDSHKVTPLMEAAEAYRPQMCKELIERGANVNMKDKFGRTALERLLINPFGWRKERPTYIDEDIYKDTIDILKQYDGVAKDKVNAPKEDML